MEGKEKERIDRIREMISKFPKSPGLYFMKDNKDKVLYIGKAKDLRSRAASYFQTGSDIAAARGAKIVEMVSRVESVDYMEAKSEVDAVLQEARLIKDIRPPYNSDLLDDKSFPYLQITTGDDFPGLYITRNPGQKKSRLFGPFTTGRDLRAALVLMQKIYKFRTCKLEISADDHKRRFFRPCLLYSINQCSAPCADKISKTEYKQIITDVTKFLRSKRSVVIRDLKKKMETAAANLDFEKAAKFRDRIRLIERLDERGTVEYNQQPEVFAADPKEANEKLAALLGSESPIRTIEGFDIAHLGGTDTVGSLVKFIDGRPFKDGYRRFRIKTVKGIDDYASLQEVVRRRYRYAAEGEELWPDLILIDGGIGQLHAIEEVMATFKGPKPYLASLAKRDEIIYISGMDKELRLAPNSPVRKLFQYVRDEAHRFAQHYHHILRNKSVIPAVDKKKK
jgi:excinuclease ABC subunit C